MRTILYFITFIVLSFISFGQSTENRVERAEASTTEINFAIPKGLEENHFNTSGISLENTQQAKKQNQNVLPQSKGFEPAAGVYHGASSATYTEGNILTDHHSGPGPDDYSDCPGTLVVSIPSGAVITGVDVYYEMTALGTGWMSDQRSRLVCTSTGGIAESSYFSGSGGAGTMVYERTGLDIANDVEGGGNISFELHAFRTWGNASGGCNDDFNVVDNGTWTVTVHYTSLLPFYDDFEEDELSASWTQYVYGAGSFVWEHNSTNSFNGEQSLRHRWNTTSEEDNWLVSPAIDLPAVHAARLSFWYRLAFMSYYTYSGVWISTGSPDPDDGDFEEIFEFNNSVNNQWDFFDLSLEEYLGETIYIALLYQGTDGHEIRIDDFRVMPSVQTPVYFYDFVGTPGLKLMDLSEPNYKYDAGLPTPGFPRAATWASGRLFHIQGNVFYSTSPDSLIYEQVLTHSLFVNGLAYNHFTNEMYLLHGNFGGSLYAVDLDLEEVTELGSVPDHILMLEGAFDNHGNLYVVYQDNNEDKVFLGIMDTDEVEISAIGSIADESTILDGLFFDYTADKLYYHYNTSGEEGQFFLVDRETGEVDELSQFGEYPRFAMVAPYSLVYFEVTDSQTNDALEGATIHFEHNLLESDDEGEAALALGYGTHEFVVSKTGYYDYHGTIELGNEHKTIEVAMNIRPQAVVAPESFSETLEEGSSVSRSITIENPVEGTELNLWMSISEISTSAKAGFKEPDPRLIPGQAGSDEQLVYDHSNTTDNKRPFPGIKSFHKSEMAKVLYLESMNGLDAVFYNGLLELPVISNLDVVNIQNQTPNVDFLLGYDLVIVTTNQAIADPELLGNQLAEYVDSGGKLILMNGVFSEGGWALQGEIMTSSYSPFAVSSYTFDDVVATDFIDHPITESVSVLESGVYSHLTLQGNSISIGEYDVDFPVGGYNPDKYIVGFNVFPHDNYWDGDLVPMINNTINWLLEGPDWLSLDTYSVTIAGGSTQEVSLSIDSENLATGNYEAVIRMLSNDLESGWVNIPVSLVVEEIPEYMLSLTAIPAQGGTLTGEGTYQAGENVTATAEANEGYEFVNWSHQGEEVSTLASYTFDMPAEDYALTAHFAAVYTLSLTAEPEEGGAVSGAGTYEAGQNVTVTAEANAGYEFVNWTHQGTQVSTSEEYSFFMPAQDYNLTAHFEEIEMFNLSLIADPEQGGVLTGEGSYEAGQSVTVTATANEGFEFVNWTHDGNEVSNETGYTFEMPSQNYSLTAHFLEVEDGYVLTLTAEPEEGGTVSGAGTYDAGQNVNVTAEAHEEYAFVNWTHNGNPVSSEASYSFFMPAQDYELVAHFELTTNVAESNWQDLEVYPNPATRILYIQSPATPDAIRVFDLNGREVYRSESPQASYQLTVDNFEEGLYLIQVLVGNDLQTIKVIIQP